MLPTTAYGNYCARLIFGIGRGRLEVLIIWRGNGFWVPLSLLLAVLAMCLGLHEAGFDLAHSDILTAHAWPFATAFAAAGLVNVGYGARANRGRDLIALDRTTGMRVRVGTRHSFYGVAMELWGVAFLVAAAALFAFRQP